MSEPFIGEIRLMPYTFAPRSWTWCQGQTMPIQSNYALFAILGTTYGGDGHSTFALPNLTNRAPMHPGRGPGLTNRWLGERDGSNTLELVESQMPAHNHRLQGAKPTGTDLPPDNSVPNSNRMISGFTDGGLTTPKSAYVKNPDAAQFVNMATSTIGTAGQSQGHENRQPFLAVNFCIALDGMFPARS
jgi:microcystin-dependent protein